MWPRRALLAVLSLADHSLAHPQSSSSRLARRDDLTYSPPSYPSPWMTPRESDWECSAPNMPSLDWDCAYSEAAKFVSTLNLLEKVNLTTGVGWMSDRCVGNTGSIPRLGMRGLCLQDGPVGVRLTNYNSVFPSGQTTAATFDRELIYARAAAIAREHKGKGVDVLLAPVAGPIGRAPEGGRNWEGFSPDPYLTGVAMAESVRGIQDEGVIACAKHFIANEQEHFRMVSESVDRGYNISEALSSNVDDKTMHELYLWPFADAVRAGVASVMCSYQQINNSYGCQNSKILNGLLKDELGFQGFVVSDWGAQHAGVSAALAGLDMSMPGDTAFNTGASFWGANLTRAVVNGTVPAWRVDDMAMRIVAALLKVGRKPDYNRGDINFSSWTLDTAGPLHAFANQSWQPQLNQHVDVRADHAKLIRRVAASGTVLLKNPHGTLPLGDAKKNREKPKFVAVVGEDAGPSRRGPNGCANRGCNDGTLAMAWGSGTAEFPYLVTPNEALQARALADGTRYESVLSNSQWDATSRLVSQPDLAAAIVFVNANSGEGFIDVGGNAGDRRNLTLWGDGDQLVRNVSALCPKTIVVIHSVGPVLMTGWHDNPNVTAIVWAGVPGQESGHAIADVLYGDVNPAGRTPFTWGPTRESFGTDLLYEPNNGDGAPQQAFTEGVFVDYRHFDRVSAAARRRDAHANVSPNGSATVYPVFPFGFGLSYTTFSYSMLSLDVYSVDRNLQPQQPDAYPAARSGSMTNAAPTFGHPATDAAVFAPPADLAPVPGYIYPYFNDSYPDPDPTASTADFLPPGAVDGSARYLPRGANPPGGHEAWYDVLLRVSAVVTNAGDRDGEEVTQLYVSLGGPDDPIKMLRGFERIKIPAKKNATFVAELTRRDLSRWDTVTQDFVLSTDNITIMIGGNSRDLPLQEEVVWNARKKLVWDEK